MPPCLTLSIIRYGSKIKWSNSGNGVVPSLHHGFLAIEKGALRLLPVVYPHTFTNINGNIIKHNLRTSMNERTHFFIKIYLSHFILERVDVSVVCERWKERHILRERNSFSHIFFQELGGANTCTLLQARQRRL